jgi:DNA (cytosine-5)-methyltransferase 1
MSEQGTYLLDLFCCEGGAGRGYADAGFTVVGVDIKSQHRYPFEFHQGEAIEVGRALLASGRFAAVHASPPCQAYSVTKSTHSVQHAELVEPTRALLIESGLPYVMENVVGAPLENALTLCGTEFGLVATDDDGERLFLRRHRLFESNVLIMGNGGCRCPEWKSRKGWRCGGVYGGGTSGKVRAREVRRGGYTPPKAQAAALIGADWMTLHGLSQSIPPAYTQHLGEQLMAIVQHAAKPRTQEANDV